MKTICSDLIQSIRVAAPRACARGAGTTAICRPGPAGAPRGACSRFDLAAAILEDLLPSQPDHPGLAHYIIHSYDYPPLAEKGLKAANAYAAMQPWVPHALHMPSHTFTRLGSWKESIDTNRRSAEAAARAGSAGEELHALDYQVSFLEALLDVAEVERDFLVHVAVRAVVVDALLGMGQGLLHRHLARLDVVRRERNAQPRRLIEVHERLHRVNRAQ